VNDLLDAALIYAAKNWPVFPVKPRDKRPHGALVPHGLKEATSDADKIQAWWAKAPEANIGLVTGVAFDVVDIDGQEGLDALVAAHEGHEEMEWGPEAVTGGGGWHILQAVTGLGNRTRLLPHVDFRGQGGYIVAPPSIHQSGRRYEWCRDAGPDLPLWPIPAWLLALIDPPVKLWTPTVIQGDAGVRLSAYARRALESEVYGVTMAVSGTRNDQLNKAAFALGQLVAGGALEVGEVVNALTRAAQGVGLGETETMQSIKSGLRSGAQHPRSLAVPV